MTPGARLAEALAERVNADSRTPPEFAVACFPSSTPSAAYKRLRRAMGVATNGHGLDTSPPTDETLVAIARQLGLRAEVKAVMSAREWLLIELFEDSA